MVFQRREVEGSGAIYPRSSAEKTKKQTIADGILAWNDSVPNTDSESDRVLIYVRRVRNNLFHGGKFNGRWFEPERSELLLGHCLTVLQACLAASPDLNTAFHS
jgi:hypothetical protein